LRLAAQTVAQHERQHEQEQDGHDAQPAAGRGFALPGGHPAAEACVALEPVQPAAADGHPVKLPHRRRDLVHLFPGDAVIGIDFEHFEIGPDGLAQLAGAGE
jgi:hypothetical protein